MQNKDALGHVLAGLSGFLVCLAISLVTGSNEAFDSPVYFRVGIPVMCALTAVISWLFPLRTWRWPVSMGAGQFLAILLGGNSLSLWPIALVVMAILSIPQLLTALAVGWLVRRNQRLES